MSPTPVDHPETRLIHPIVNVKETLPFQDPQRYEAQRCHSEMSPVTYLLPKPAFHPVNKSDSLEGVLSLLTRQSNDQSVRREPVVLIEDPRPIVDNLLPLVRTVGLYFQRHVFSNEFAGSCLKV